MFLPDRYIKGECPVCGAKDQYGDSCEVCGSVYAPTDLKNPYSTLTGATPVLKSSEHFFFRLSDPQCVSFLRRWTQTPQAAAQVANKALEWLAEKPGGDGKGLADWDISRDPPYFGIPIPDAPGKYFYVWLDAPVGYLASLKADLASKGIALADFLRGKGVEQYHFIGKDIVYHHTLFWPAMLEFAGPPYKVPDNIFVHGFITFTGEKMSKSRGTGISPELYLDLGLNPEWLRYYIAAKLNAKVEDLDFNPDDFIARVNSDLIGKYVNIASRAARFIAQTGNKLAPTSGFDARHGVALHALSDRIAELYANREFGKALREVMDLADQTNEYFDRNKPWEAAKRPDGAARVLEICSECIDDFRFWTTLLAGAAGCRQRRAVPADSVAGVERYRHRAAGRARDRRLQAPVEPHRPEAGRCAARGPEGGDRRGVPTGRRAGRQPAPGCAADQHRRVFPDRSSRRAHCQRRAGRRRRQAAEIDARRRRSAPSDGVRRDQERVPAAGPGRPLDADGRQSRPSQNEVRRFGRHGARGIGRGSGNLSARAGFGRRARHARQVGAMARAALRRTRNIQAFRR
jgi:hypothetical protein